MMLTSLQKFIQLEKSAAPLYLNCQSMSVGFVAWSCGTLLLIRSFCSIQQNRLDFTSNNKNELNQIRILKQDKLFIANKLIEIT